MRRRSARGSSACRRSRKPARRPRTGRRTNTTMTLPTLFIPHGAGPCFFMEWTRGAKDEWDRTAAWLKGLIAGLPERPKAILVISGHWEEPAFTVGSAAHPPLIYDYYGFPEHTYRLVFDAPGSPALASRVKDLLTKAGLPARTD